MKITFNKEMVKKLGAGSWTVGKAIIWEGVKGVLLKSAANVITTSFDSGLSGVKKMTVNDYVGKKKLVIDKVKVESVKKDRVVVDAEFETVKEQD